MLAGAGACTLLGPASQTGAPVAFGISAAAAAATDLRCGALLDATGARVSPQDPSGQVVTSAPRRCAARDSAPRKAGPSIPIHSGAIPGLSAEPVPRPATAHEEPLRFAAENPERVGAALLTGGAMLWVLHSSFWTSLLVLGLPLWRHVDLLPIVATAPESDASDAPPPPTPEEAAVAQVLEDHGARTRDAGRPA
jgi:hypothetical protein